MSTSNPLDFYRNKASFDWKKLKIFMETEETFQVEKSVCEILENYPQDKLFPSFDEERRYAAMLSRVFSEIYDTYEEDVTKNKRKVYVVDKLLTHFSTAATTKVLLKYLFGIAVLVQGTERHQAILQQVLQNKFLGCFCLTEIGHGSNIKQMRTTATYDKEIKEFILNTPDFEAAKCWSGSLGQTAAYAVVYAQLYIDDFHAGLHAFLVPIRDPQTLVPYPGVLVGDMGEKIGLQGLDNGFLIFDKYHIPRENLLNRFTDVTPDGEYVTRFRNYKESLGAALGAIAIGRVNLSCGSEILGTKALTIAIRYSAVRKQFGPEGHEEIPILEYQSQQCRLLPYLAASYVMRFFEIYFSEVAFDFLEQSVSDQSNLGTLGTEIHVLSCACKPVFTWTFRDAIQECREACGGHGYLKAAGIGTARNDNDANSTADGENHVIIQQTGNWLVKMWPQIERGEEISTPLQSANFLSQGLGILDKRFKAANVEEVCHPDNIIDAYQWLVCYLLKQTKLKLDALIPQLGDFWARNNTQVFYLKNLGAVYMQHFLLQRMLVTINEAGDANIRKVLTKLFSLYGLWSLEKSLVFLYEGGYAQGSKMSRLVHDAILELCADIKDDAVSLVDVVAPPDFILNSALGASDGQVYKRLQSAFLHSPYSRTRPSWWQEVVNWKTTLNHKL